MADDVERAQQNPSPPRTGRSTKPLLSRTTFPQISNISNIRKVPVRLMLSYVFDWLVIIAIFAAGGGINFVSPNKRAFSLLDLSISYPYITESVSVLTLVMVSLVAPGVIIAFVAIVLVPSRTVSRQLSRSQIVTLKLWELEKGLAGLALSTAAAFFVTQGLKQLNGKPRPDMLARCQPDLNNIAAHAVGGYGQDLSARWTLVAASICKNPDHAFVDEGFRSFPSGHSTWSWAGLLYLSLFLCSKFAIRVPYLPPGSTSQQQYSPPQTDDVELLPLHNNSSSSSTKPSTSSVLQSKSTAASLSVRDTAASPPTYLIVVAFTPIAVAFFICSTRYYEYWHHGFDIISGALIGIISAWMSFRWYHAPLSHGEGWAWGARDVDRAWGVGVGTGAYVAAGGREK